MRRIQLALTFMLLGSLPVAAAPEEDAQRLYDALGMPEIIDVMRTEGLEYGDSLRDELFPGRGGAAWDTLVADVYDAEAMEGIVRETFADLIAETDTLPLVEFFTDPLGARIIRLEIEARRALLDEDVEDAAREALADMRQDGDARLDMLDDFIEANDLIESNVVGAMNSNYAFYTGLLEGDAFDGTMTESQMLSDVWSQEPEIRADTIDWVYSYLALAYQPLSDAEVQTYIDLSRTEPGEALNRAIFGAFDAMYVTISRALGQGAAQFIAGEDL